MIPISHAKYQNIQARTVKLVAPTIKFDTPKNNNFLHYSIFSNQRAITPVKIYAASSFYNMHIFI